jgi:hypothetical protein
MPGTSLSGASQAFDTAYPDHPWAGLDRNQRQWYDPILRDVYRKKNVFGQFTTFQQNLGGVNAKTMTINGLYDLHPNTDPLGLRQMWLPAAHVDSWQVDVTFERHGNKIAYDMYDKIITYWRTTGNMNADTLRSICNDKLGLNIADTLDLLSRNALLNVPYRLHGPDGEASDFSGITTDKTFRTGTLEDIHLGMANRDVPYASNPTGDVGSIVCVTTPGVIYDLRRQTDPKDWLYRMAYASPSRLLNYEVGTLMNVRFVVTPKNTLWNAGPITIQASVSVPINAGDGAPSGLVDSTKRVGQAAATHYITLVGGTDMSQFAKNDMITLHTMRTSANGVANGVDYTDGTVHNLIIDTIDVGNRRLSFKKPIMTPFTTDLGGGVYAWVTKGVHVHASIFIGGPDAVVSGVGRPMMLHYPPPVDDLESIYRVSWDLYSGYGNYNPDVAEVVFTAGSTRVIGPNSQ